MAMRCQNCGKGVGYGQAVSHAKNRTKRLFKPNLQKLKVQYNGEARRVKLCTSCIQRLKRDKKLGKFAYLSFSEKINRELLKKAVVASPQKEKKEAVSQEAMNIADIVGKKS